MALIVNLRKADAPAFAGAAVVETDAAFAACPG